MGKLKLFLGSSVKGLPYARVVQKNLNYEAWPRVWNQGIFRTGRYPVDDLLAALDDSDFGAFLFLPEDVLIVNGSGPASMAARDNVLFELGMFIGRLGIGRAFIIKPRDQPLHLPSDLTGVNLADFNDDPNLDSALGPATTDILDLMRRAGPKASVAVAAGVSPTPGYDRAQALELAIGKAKPRIEGMKFTQSDVILASGDVKSSERLEGVQSYSAELIAGVPVFLQSTAGRFALPRIESLTEGQGVTLNWTESKTSSQAWEGTMVFSPPLEKGRPISFRRERYTANAISFTQRERRDVTNRDATEEEISVSFGGLYREYIYQLVFPEGRFPARFRLNALLNDVRDDDESAFAERHLTDLPGTNTLLLNLPQPLPGYKYSVNWELLADKADAGFTKVQAGFVEEMTRRLLGLRTVNKANTQAVRDALQHARRRLLPDEASPERVEVSLFVYDRQWSSLICVASLDADLIERQWETYMFKPGRGVAGWAFRQRKAYAYYPENAIRNGEQERYEPLTEDDRELPPQAVTAFPLFYLGNFARSVAVLSLTARVPNCELVALAKDSARLDAVSGELNKWYESELADALGVIASATFWRL